MITGKQLVEKLYSEGWELEQREYGLLSKMKGFISKRNLEKYYRYKGELNRLKNEKSKIQGELSNLDERAPKNMKLERAIQREAINDIGLPETAKAYKRMMEKYTNPELHNRFKRIQAASSNNRLRIARQNVKDSGQYVIDPSLTFHLIIKNFIKNEKQRELMIYVKLQKIIRNKIEQIQKSQIKSKKKELEKIIDSKEKNIESNYDNEFSELETKYNQAKKLNTTLGYDPESAQKILKDLKKDNIKTAVGSNLTTEYNYKNDTININNIHRKNPYTILHEVGHRVSDNREQLRGGKYYGNYRSLDKKVNNSHNLHNSIMNNVGNLSTLMNEANASYHAAALAKKYNLPREMQKAGNKSLDYSFRTYESNAANKMMTDDTVRLLGKYKNK